MQTSEHQSTTQTTQLTFGSLFSGIGGLDLGLERAGMRCLWQSEIDHYASRVLNKHWPNTPNLGDIRDINWTTVPRTDVICGGYPCQPFSVAGQRNGVNDPRHLWPYFADAIRILRPRYALLENVAGHLTLGFGSVASDLASLGYDIQWDCIPASSVGAPHRRDRLFILAHTTRSDGNRPPQQPRMASTRWATPKPREPYSDRKPADHWSTRQPDIPRVADGVPDRLDRLRCLGNAVVPQVAEHIGHIINQHHHTLNK